MDCSRQCGKESPRHPVAATADEKIQLMAASTKIDPALLAKVESIFQTVLLARTSSPLPIVVKAEFAPFASANCRIIKVREGWLVKISDLLQTAPDAVFLALAEVLVAKVYRQRVPSAALRCFRSYLRRPEMAARATETKRLRGRKEISAPQGQIHDLVAMFDKLNLQYFGGLMSRPQLGWSLRGSRRYLGHFDPHHHAIVLSRALDTEELPAFAVEFVMYHEMLHLRFPVERKNGRRCIHSAAFKQEERRFVGFLEAEKALRRFAWT
jgi:hypothetical protein